MTLDGIQILRFLAAFSIVLLHSFHRGPWVHHGFNGSSAEWLESGVDVFFVISGFIMAYTIRPETRTVDFALRRILRVAPLYWFVSVVAGALSIVTPFVLVGKLSLSNFFESIVFATPIPFYRVGWTLEYELLFYMILALCLGFGKYRYVAASAVIAAITISGVVLQPEHYRYPWDAFAWRSSDGMMVEFLFGVAIYHWHKRLPVRAIGSWFIVILGYGLIVISGTLSPSLPRSLAYGLPAALVVFGFVKNEAVFRTKWMAVLVLLGSASYSIYLVHFMVLNAVGRILAQSHIFQIATPAVTIVFLAVCGVASGLACYLLVELRLISAGRQLHSRLLSLTPRRKRHQSALQEN